MAKNNRKGIIYPKNFMKTMKKKKHKKLRNAKLNVPVIEKQFNDAELTL